MLKFEFEIQGEVQVLRAFSRFGENIRDFRDAFRRIAFSFWGGEKKQFESQGAYGSGGWAPLSPQYAARKASQFPGRPILVRTGALKASLLGRGGGAIHKVQPLSMEIGSAISYGIYHQKGTKKMVARKPIELPESQKKEWHKIIHKFIFEQAKKAGFKIEEVIL